MVDLDRLSKLIPAEQRPERVHRMWRAIEAERHRQAHTRWRTWQGMALVSAGTIAAAIMLFVNLSPKPATGPLTALQGKPLPAAIMATASMERRFSDGSLLRVTAGTRLSLVENSGKSVKLSLQKGHARFDIVPGGPREWQVDCGKMVVTVLGTAFIVEKENDHMAVAVERGVVLVSGESLPDGERRLTAGDSIEIGDADERPALQEADHPGDDSPAAVAPMPEMSLEKTKPLRASWQVHAEAGNYAEAFEQLGPSGVASLAKQSKDVDELFKLADVARLSGHPLNAITPLESIIEEFAENPRAGLAAYTLGRLYLEQLALPVKAVAAFERALTLGIPEALAEAAMVKQTRALLSQKDARGRALASEYLSKYPNGRYREEVQRWLAGDTNNLR